MNKKTDDRYTQNEAIKTFVSISCIGLQKLKFNSGVLSSVQKCAKTQLEGIPVSFCCSKVHSHPPRRQTLKAKPFNHASGTATPNPLPQTIKQSNGALKKSLSFVILLFLKNACNLLCCKMYTSKHSYLYIQFCAIMCVNVFYP